MRFARHMLESTDRSTGWYVGGMGAGESKFALGGDIEVLAAGDLDILVGTSCQHACSIFLVPWSRSYQ